MSCFVSRRCSISGKSCDTVLRALPILAMPSEMNHLHLLDLRVLRQVPDEPFAS